MCVSYVFLLYNPELQFQRALQAHAREETRCKQSGTQHDQKCASVLVSKLNTAEKFTALKRYPNSFKNGASKKLKVILHFKKMKRPFFVSQRTAVLTNSGLGYIQVLVA